MNLDLELVRTFLAVIEQGGFTRAAGRLHKTQSTISLHIRRLEEIVGRPLFDRQGRGVALTEQGEVLRSLRGSVARVERRSTVEAAATAGDRHGAARTAGGFRHAPFAAGAAPFHCRASRDSP
ncbi:LysR family transcriptional regulator [Bradyrhizobium sp. 13971]